MINNIYNSYSQTNSDFGGFYAVLMDICIKHVQFHFLKQLMLENIR